jgi:glycosyltransferase involved in cell wall biosynthesis
MNTPSRPLRLVLVANRHQYNDGQGRVNYEVALAALNSGMKVTLLTAYCADEIANHPNAHFVHIGKEQLPTQFLRNLAFANESARWLREHRGEFDLVQANGFVTWESCDIVTAHFVHTSFAKSPYYPFARSLRPYALYQRVFTALNARWERRAFHTAKHIIAVSDAVAEDVRQLGVPSERVEVIYNGVDIDEFSPLCWRHQNVAQEPGHPPTCDAAHPASPSGCRWRSEKKSGSGSGEEAQGCRSCSLSR